MRNNLKYTQAAVLHTLGEPLRIETLTVPELRPGQVLVVLAYSCVCGSQLLEARGKRGPDRFLPHTLGHEGSGTVAAIGAGVTKVRPGDRVVLTWIRGNGIDVPSTTYSSAGGPVSSGAISTFMTHSVVSESRLVSIPPELPLRDAALLGCAIPTGGGIICHAARVTPGTSVAVFGVGGVGLAAVLFASLCQATTILAVDITETKLQQARDAGATHTINAATQDVLQIIQRATAGQGVDYAIEAAGRPQTMEAAFQATRYHGGVCVLAGNLPEGERVTLNPYDLIRGKKLMGTWGGEAVPERDIPRYAALILSGKLRLDKLPLTPYRLEDLNQALDDLEKARLYRPLLKLDPDCE